MEAMIVIFFFFSIVHGCPFLVQPSSLNVSQGTSAQFTVVTCGTTVIWSVDNLLYAAGYNSSGVSVVQETLNSTTVHSKLTLPTNSFKYDNAMVTATVFAPQAIRSNNVLLRIQGKLFIYIPSSPPLISFYRTTRCSSWPQLQFCQPAIDMDSSFHSLWSAHSLL